MARRMYTVEEIKEICEPVFRNNPFVLRASLFGSYARGDQTPKSDIDVLVEMTEEATLLDESGLFLDLKCALRKSVDLVDVDAKQYSTTPELWANILREERPIYEKH